eukprot:TRINITY_DN5771_c1_g1_i1.p1 TRINITY_DN5771_c1_g1~~TRINITY_DN5771_c1_g1_i1.p1  ORF type:complete len:398 (+),score=79.16 TRINITY_DN5771_c1_g1_i1:137-1330(+)
MQSDTINESDWILLPDYACDADLCAESHATTSFGPTPIPTPTATLILTTSYPIQTPDDKGKGSRDSISRSTPGARSSLLGTLVANPQTYGSTSHENVESLSRSLQGEALLRELSVRSRGVRSMRSGPSSCSGATTTATATATATTAAALGIASSRSGFTFQPKSLPSQSSRSSRPIPQSSYSLRLQQMFSRSQSPRNKVDSTNTHATHATHAIIPNGSTIARTTTSVDDGFVSSAGSNAVSGPDSGPDSIGKGAWGRLYSAAVGSHISLLSDPPLRKKAAKDIALDVFSPVLLGSCYYIPGCAAISFHGKPAEAQLRQRGFAVPDQILHDPSAIDRDAIFVTKAMRDPVVVWEEKCVAYTNCILCEAKIVVQQIKCPECNGLQVAEEPSGCRCCSLS